MNFDFTVHFDDGTSKTIYEHSYNPDQRASELDTLYSGGRKFVVSVTFVEVVL